MDMWNRFPWICETVHPPRQLQKPGPSCTHSSSVATKRATACAIQHSIRVITPRQASADTIHTAVCEDFTTQSFYACVVSKDVNRRIKIQMQADRNEHCHVIVWPVECEQTPTFAAMLLFFYGISRIFSIFPYLRGYWGPALNPITDLCPIVKIGNDRRGQKIDLAATNQHLHPHFRTNQDISCGHKLPGTEWLIGSTWQIPGGLLGFFGPRAPVFSHDTELKYIVDAVPGLPALSERGLVDGVIRFDSSRRHGIATLVECYKRSEFKKKKRSR